jgi:hypothetical protein
MRDAAEKCDGQQAVQDNQKRCHLPPGLPVAATGKTRHAAGFSFEDL